MDSNVIVAIIAGCAAIISAVIVLGGAIFAYSASHRRFDAVDKRLDLIQADLKEFFRQVTKLELRIDREK